MQRFIQTWHATGNSSYFFFLDLGDNSMPMPWQTDRRAGTLFHWFNSIMGNGITLDEDDGDDDVDVNQNVRMCKTGIC